MTVRRAHRDDIAVGLDDLPPLYVEAVAGVAVRERMGLPHRSIESEREWLEDMKWNEG